MINAYKVVKEKNEDILYLYINTMYEFATDFSIDNTKKILQKEKITFNGNKVVYVVDGVVQKTIRLPKNEIITDESQMDVTKNQTMSLNDVLLSLLFTNIHLDLPLEVLKCITILYRSELLKMKEEHTIVKRTNQHFSFIPISYFKLNYPFTYQKYQKIYQQAIFQTKGMYLVYHGQKIESFIHIASNGLTEAKEDVPYLIKKESFWDMTYPNYLQIKHFTLQEIKNKFDLVDDVLPIKIVKLTNSNRIDTLKIGKKELKAADLFTTLQLPSLDATILVEKDGLTFVTRGQGDGYGLSLWGAKALAELDCNYLQILGYYFHDLTLITNVEIL